MAGDATTLSGVVDGGVARGTGVGRRTGAVPTPQNAPSQPRRRRGRILAFTYTPASE